VWSCVLGPRLSLSTLSRSLFHSMRDANPTRHLRPRQPSGHFGNDCRPLAPNPNVEVYWPSRRCLLAGGRADREMPHKWWIFRPVRGFDGGFLPREFGSF